MKTETRIENGITYKIKVYEDRTEWFNSEGKLHRDGGLPAIERADGYKVYCVNGQRHRDGGLPAVEGVNGYKAYYVNGKLHRDEGLPAREWANGDKAYWANGQRHRDGGLPAIERANGSKEYFVNDKQLTEQEALFEHHKQLRKEKENEPIVSRFRKILQNG